MRVRLDWHDVASSQEEAESITRRNRGDGRSPAAGAAQWASRIMTISLEMVLPGLAGYWFDTKLGTKFVFMLVGFALGGTAALKHLLYLAKKENQSPSDISIPRNEP